MLCIQSNGLCVLYKTCMQLLSCCVCMPSEVCGPGHMHMIEEKTLELYGEK